MSREIKATLTFAGFALLLAFRDVTTEIWLSKENTLWVTFTVCATILILSFVYVLVNKQYGLVKKLRTPGAMPRVAMLGLFSGGIYLGIFFLIAELGAGLWGLIDYGLIPLATASVGWIMFKEKLTNDFFWAFLVYFLGVTILMVARGEFIDVKYLGIALLLPITSALSDGYTKWLLDKDKAGLTKSELLIVRFLPAVIVSYGIAAITSHSMIPQIDDLPTTIAVAVTGGWAPLMLLCTGLGIAGMKKLAVWEFMIPALTFFGTLHLHAEFVGFPILGAVLILSGIVISEWKAISKIKMKQPLLVIRERRPVLARGRNVRRG